MRQVSDGRRRTRLLAPTLIVILFIVGGGYSCASKQAREGCSGSSVGTAGTDTLRFLPPVPDLSFYLAGFGREDIPPPPDTLEAIGVGSLPAKMYGDGSICLLDPSRPGDHGQLLFRLPDSLQILRRRALAFLLDGVFDLDRCGSPEVFMEYSGEDGELSGVTFLVFKRRSGRYLLDQELGARSEGYAPAAWFLDESPKRRAIFMTRAEGSSGAGLFCLEAGQTDFQEIPAFLTDYPDFVDLDKDGHAEICVPYFHGSGDDCWSLWHLQRGEYVRWWPERRKGPYVTDAKVADLDGHGCGSIVAVLMPRGPQGPDDPAWNDVRHLAVWRLRDGEWREVAVTRLPDSEDPEYPEVSDVRREADGARIDLAYGESATRTYLFQADSLTRIGP